MEDSDTLRQIIGNAVKSAKASSDFDLNPAYRQPNHIKLRPAAVLLAFFETPEGTRLILTKRSTSLHHHPGQIAFPGGKVDQADRDAEEAALREAEEEIGLARDNVEIIGRLPPHETVTGFSISPILGRVRAYFEPIPETGEVDEVFSVPCEFISSINNFMVQSRIWQSKPRFYYTVPYGPYYIWGATARILHSLAGGRGA